MHHGLLLMAVLCIGCLVVQLLPVISVPITGAGGGFNLYLLHYRDHKFGVFGLCDVKRNVCTPARIGYPSRTHGLDDLGDWELPSMARYTILKLLVVHVVLFCMLGCLLLVIVVLMVAYQYDSGVKLRIVEPQPPAASTAAGASAGDAPQPPVESCLERPATSQARTRNLEPLLDLMLVCSLLSFISTLLSFLSDILLFIPHLSFLGWLQFFPIITLPLMAAMICFMKRLVSLRRYLEDFLRGGAYNDDMRRRRSPVVDDSDSDDGFYVFTNGFYSTYNNEEEHHHRPRLASSNNGWRRHTPREGEADLGHPAVELEDLQFDEGMHRVSL
jgi:hypothetical protein